MLDPKKWRVLVVEDEFDSIQMVSKILQHHGATVHIAHNGHECMEMLGQVNPNLVIMDLALPEMDGWEMFQRARSLDALSDVPGEPLDHVPRGPVGHVEVGLVDADLADDVAEFVEDLLHLGGDRLAGVRIQFLCDEQRHACGVSGEGTIGERVDLVELHASPGVIREART